MVPDVRYAESTVPMDVPVTVRGGGFGSEADARDFAILVATHVQAIGRSLDLSTLDSVTIATEAAYKNSLLELDRGVATRSILSPTNADYGQGVAMTPAVLRNGVAKSAMFLRTECVLPLRDSKDASYSLAFHLLYHECAHVDVSMALNHAFPSVRLTPMNDLIRSQKWAQLLPCWDEFAACYLSANVGDKAGVLRGYTDIFLEVLNSTQGEIEDHIRAYRHHGRHTAIMRDVFGLCGNLMKFGSYLLGTLSGQGRSWIDLEEIEAAVSGSWFGPYLGRLDRLLNEIMASYGKWESLDEFEALGDLVADVVAENGLFLRNTKDGVHVHVPF